MIKISSESKILEMFFLSKNFMSLNVTRTQVRDLDDGNLKQTPAPNCYSPNRKYVHYDPKFTLHDRVEERNPRAVSPGPDAYNIDRTFAKDAVSFTMHGRPPLPSENKRDLPSPNAYHPNPKALSHIKNLQPGIGQRVNLPMLNQGMDSPSPNQYGSPSRSIVEPRIASSFLQRTNFMDFVAPYQKGDDMVGPGRYSPKRGVADDNVFRDYSFHIRPQVSERSKVPGPGAYNVPSTIGRTNAFSFGIKPAKTGMIILEM